MHLAIYHEPVHTDGRTYDTYGAFARYVREFARHFERVTVFAPATDRPTYFSGVPLEEPNVTVVPLPFFQTHAQAYLRAWRIAGAFRRHCADVDVVNARGTAPLAYLLWWYTRRRNVPFLYHFASDPFEAIRRSPRYRGPVRLLARALYAIEFAVQKHIMRRNYSFASGSALCNRLRRDAANVEAVITSSLLPEDYRLRDDCCRGQAVRLLYVGYLRTGKGLDRLVEGVAILRRQGRDVELDLVGQGECRPALEKQASGLGLEGAVRFRGHLVMGPDLNAAYDAADIFVLPSLSEGSPKVVLEAMAHSLPVVATDVGNVSEMLDGGRRGVLLAAPDPDAIASGVTRLLEDAELRRRCIRDGYAFALHHGVSAFVARMAERARQMVRQRRLRAGEPR